MYIYNKKNIFPHTLLFALLFLFCKREVCYPFFLSHHSLPLHYFLHIVSDRVRYTFFSLFMHYLLQYFFDFVSDRVRYAVFFSHYTLPFALPVSDKVKFSFCSLISIFRTVFSLPQVNISV